MTTKKKTIEERNAEFWKLSKAKQRVAIAKDVIAQVRAKKYKATCGSWFDHPLIELRTESPVDLQKVLLESNRPCAVCGIGGAFASMARLGNKLTNNSGIYESLERVFSKAQVRLIEGAFERGEYGADTPNGAAFGKRYPNDSKRMIAIFRNVIKNGGTFKP